MPLSLSRSRSIPERSIDRGQFLRGNWRGVANAIRPPWSLGDERYFKTCTQCNECLSACPEHILVPDSKGYPQVDFKRGECTFCGECETNCKPGALRDTGQKPWSYHAQINNQCLSVQGISCRSCADNCDSQAIRFQLALGGIANPEIKLEDCNGCGACIAPCPVNSIEITQQRTAE